MKTDWKFMGASVLSGLASIVFSIFLIGGFIGLVSSQSIGQSEFLPGIQIATIRIFGGCAAIFGMFGLMVACGLDVLIAIEKQLRARSKLKE